MSTQLNAAPGNWPSAFAKDGHRNGQAFGVARDDNPITLATADT